MLRGFPAVDQRADDLAADSITSVSARLRQPRHLPRIHYYTVPFQSEIRCFPSQFCLRFLLVRGNVRMTTDKAQ